MKHVMDWSYCLYKHVVPLACRSPMSALCSAITVRLHYFISPIYSEFFTIWTLPLATKMVFYATKLKSFAGLHDLTRRKWKWWGNTSTSIRWMIVCNTRTVLFIVITQVYEYSWCILILCHGRPNETVQFNAAHFLHCCSDICQCNLIGLSGLLYALSCVQRKSIVVYSQKWCAGKEWVRVH